MDKAFWLGASWSRHPVVAAFPKEVSLIKSQQLSLGSSPTSGAKLNHLQHETENFRLSILSKKMLSLKSFTSYFALSRVYVELVLAHKPFRFRLYITTCTSQTQGHLSCAWKFILLEIYPPEESSSHVPTGWTQLMKAEPRGLLPHPSITDEVVKAVLKSTPIRWGMRYYTQLSPALLAAV